MQLSQLALRTASTALALALGVLVVGGCSGTVTVGPSTTSGGGGCVSIPAGSVSCPGNALWATQGSLLVGGTGLVIDSYNSGLGAYGGANVGTQGNIRAGGSFLSGAGSVTITGSQVTNSPASLARAAPTTSSLGVLNLVAGNNTLASGDYYYSVLNISAIGSTLNTTGGVVRIWFDTLNCSGSGATIGTGPPGNLWLMGTCGAVANLSGVNTTISAVIYNPSGTVNFNGNNTTVYGAIVASNINLSANNLAFHRDFATCGY